MCLQEYINTTDMLFDDVVAMTELPPERPIDFCSIDIDGLDLEVFETFERYLPSVVCIEGGQMLHPFHPRVPAEIAEKNIQQSLSTMNEAFTEKGYRLICSYQDSFFVKEEFYHLFDVSKSLMNLYLDGVAALPKIPWITEKLEEVGLSNSILDAVRAFSQFEFLKARTGSTVDKMAWVDNQYEAILQTLALFREEEPI